MAVRPHDRKTDPKILSSLVLFSLSLWLSQLVLSRRSTQKLHPPPKISLDVGFLERAQRRSRLGANQQQANK